MLTMTSRRATVAESAEAKSGPRQQRPPARRDISQRGAEALIADLLYAEMGLGASIVVFCRGSE